MSAHQKVNPASISKISYFPVPSNYLIEISNLSEERIKFKSIDQKNLIPLDNIKKLSEIAKEPLRLISSAKIRCKISTPTYHK